MKLLATRDSGGLVGDSVDALTAGLRTTINNTIYTMRQNNDQRNLVKNGIAVHPTPCLHSPGDSIGLTVGSEFNAQISVCPGVINPNTMCH